MSMVLTTYGRQQMVNAFWTPDIFTPLTVVYFCYTRAVAQSNADGSQLDEPDPGAGYIRVGYPLSSSKWSPSGFGEIYNTDLTFFAAVTGDWGLVQGMALADTSDPGTGNVLAVGNITEPFQPAVGSIPIVDIADVVIGLYE